MKPESAHLATKVQEHLCTNQIETPGAGWKAWNDVTRTAVAISFREIMETMNLDLKDDSLSGTPERVAKMFLHEIFYGLDYRNFPDVLSIQNKMHCDEVITTTCQVRSMCEHHFVPFMGTAYIGYIPKDKVLGLSKFNRIVDFFSRRPQIQERLTEQVSASLQIVLETDDVAVVIKAEHFCVKLRGVQDTLSKTTTSKLQGRFRSVPELRAEFLSLTK